MPRRQVWFFRFGSWSAIVSGAACLAAHVLGLLLPAGAAERAALGPAAVHQLTMPGGAARSLLDLVDGGALAVALLLAAIGGIGLIVAKRGRADVVLMSAVARAVAVAAVGLLVISLTKFFIVPTLFIAVVATCFLVASVEAPAGAG
jgi:hypothetical protein